MVEEIKKTKRAPKRVLQAEKERYVGSVGRRKAAIARVRLYPKECTSPFSEGDPFDVTVNGRPLLNYTSLSRLRKTAVAPFAAVGTAFKATVRVTGGGITGQAEAIRLGIARALIVINVAWRPRLKSLGFLRRDPRVVERKKPGLRKARRPQQWRKR